MKVKGLDAKFRHVVRAWDRSRVVGGGPRIASCGVGFSAIVVHWRDSAAFWAREVDTGGLRCLGVWLVRR